MWGQMQDSLAVDLGRDSHLRDHGVPPGRRLDRQDFLVRRGPHSGGGVTLLQRPAARLRDLHPRNSAFSQVKCTSGTA